MAGVPTRTPLRCSCGGTHTLTPTALIELANAFYDGEAQTVTAEGVVAECAVTIVTRNPAFAR